MGGRVGTIVITHFTGEDTETQLKQFATWEEARLRFKLRQSSHCLSVTGRARCWGRGGAAWSQGCSQESPTREEQVPEIPPLEPWSARSRGSHPQLSSGPGPGYWPTVLIMATRWRGCPGCRGPTGQRETEVGQGIFPRGRQPQPSHPPLAPWRNHVSRACCGCRGSDSGAGCGPGPG